MKYKQAGRERELGKGIQSSLLKLITQLEPESETFSVPHTHLDVNDGNENGKPLAGWKKHRKQCMYIFACCVRCLSFALPLKAYAARRTLRMINAL